MTQTKISLAALVCEAKQTSRIRETLYNNFCEARKNYLSMQNKIPFYLLFFFKKMRK